MEAGGDTPVTLRVREIGFRGPHAVTDQAQRASELLCQHQGVLQAEPLHPRLLRVHYDLRITCLYYIETHLERDGLHLDNGLLMRLKRALYYYCEENLCAQLREAPTTHPDATDQLFVNCYRRLRHGCRDHRPEHWRHYL